MRFGITRRFREVETARSVDPGYERLIRSSPLFDESFYIAQNSDAGGAESDPVRHFLSPNGRSLSCHPLFDSSWYLSRYADVEAAGVNPLVHYLECGWSEGRDPHPLFDSDWYWKQNEDGTPQLQNPLLHYLSSGWRERRSPCALFDEAFYQSEYPEVSAANRAGLLDYLLSGAAQGRNPNHWFDTRWYVAQNSQALRKGLNPLIHYATVGAREGRRTRSLPEKPKHSKKATTRSKILFVSGEPKTPGHRYRVVNLAKCLPPKYFDSRILTISDIPRVVGDMTEADIVWLWRAGMSPETELLLAAHRQRRFTLIYDIDDLMFRPELAIADEIDGIRSQNIPEVAVRAHYESIRCLLTQVDHCTAPTAELAAEMRDYGRPATVIPNGFDRKFFERARQAVEERRCSEPEGLFRIGYAAGTLTHQRDLKQASGPIAAILKEHPRARLVLFRGTVLIDEFPEFVDVRHHIEWREPVPLDDLPSEYARFDINIAPLEVGNRYCESKSELKFFESALLGVPTIASPTSAYRSAIRHRETGFLANDGDDWYDYLDQLINDPSMRSRVANAAYSQVLWDYGPERRTLLTARLVNQLLAPAPSRYELFRIGMQSEERNRPPANAVPDYTVLFQSRRNRRARVSVVIPVYNYAHYLEEALESVLQQTLHDIDLIVVDDRSTDNSVEVARKWLEQYQSRFQKAALLQNKRNSKLGKSRNAGVHFCDTELYMPLDADNALLPDCLELCMRALDETGAAFAYPTIVMFGDRHDQLGTYEYDPARFQCGNYIDAMALVRKACWASVGGYSALDPMGWEDYEFWCKLAEKGLYGVRVPETSARYRTHAQSMLRTFTDREDVQPLAVAEMNRRHPWLRLNSTSKNGSGSRQNASTPARGHNG